jgi:bifunctional UDP-N-acetylglucosamine pyrophosphorylase / glucosamine-1-phosphate N-acetyltransferase
MSSPASNPSKSPTAVAPPAAIILAAGKGTRMKGDLPKVVHPVGGRPMVCAVVDACRGAGCGRIVVVVGYKQELVRAALAGYEGIEFAVQAEQLGTGHAVLSARGALDELARRAQQPVFILAGDGPLIRSATLRTMLERHAQSGAAATLATSIIEDPKGYGRIVRDGGGRFERIVEHKDATEEQRKIREVYPSYACVDARELLAELPKVPKNGASGEYYVTDLFALLLAQGKRVEVVAAVPPEDVLSINTPEELERVDRIYRSRDARTSPTVPAAEAMR